MFMLVSEAPAKTRENSCTKSDGFHEFHIRNRVLNMNESKLFSDFAHISLSSLLPVNYYNKTYRQK